MAGLSFAFDPSKGETPDTIAKKRAIAEAIAARAMSGAPRNVGEGLNAVGQALLYRQMMRKADTAQREGSQGASAAFSSLFGGNFPEAPAAPQSAPTADYPSQRVAQAHGDNPYRDAIASIESDGSGGYSAIGPTHPELGRALGRYQVMEANIGPWSKAALGREVTADEFLSDPKLQDAVFDHRFGQYVEKYGPEKAAQAWFAGEGGIGTNRQDSLGTSVPEYVQKFNRALGQGGAQRVAQAMPEMAGNTVQQPGTPDANRIMQVLSNPFLSDSQKRIAELLLNQTMQANDPMRQMQLEKGRLELEQMRNPQPKPTDDMREYEFAKGQGYEGTFQQFMTDMKKAGATNVTVGGSEVGTIPQGWELVTDPQTGARSMRPIAGGPAAMEAQQAAEADENRAKGTAERSGLIAEEIDRALSVMDSGVLPDTGWGAMLADMPGTDAKALQALLGTIKANIGFDELNKMRAQSKTGGALGQVTERELAFLQSVAGSLDQSQSSKDLKYNLDRLWNGYMDVIHGEGKGPKRRDLGAAPKGNRTSSGIEWSLD